MNADLTPDDRKAFEAAMLQVQESQVRFERANDALDAASASGDHSVVIDAAGEVFRAAEALEQAWLDAGRWGGGPGLVPTQAEVARGKLAFRQQVRGHFPVVLDRLININCSDSTDPELPQIRAEAKRVLLGTNLVTEHELETFPEESVKAIVAQRYQVWAAEN
jgi:hypothetical protein